MCSCDRCSQWEYLRRSHAARYLCSNYTQNILVLDEGELDDEEEGYHYSAKKEGEITDDIALQRVGEVKKVQDTCPLWGRLVPSYSTVPKS